MSPVFFPTRKQIAAECEEIRSAWSEPERMQRLLGPQSPRLTRPRRPNTFDDTGSTTGPFRRAAAQDRGGNSFDLR